MQASHQLKNAAIARHSSELMRLSRLGSAFPTRLSFMRVLLRDLAVEGVKVTRPRWDINEDGHGQAVYSLTSGKHTYSLVAISTPLADKDRSDRVIAEAWDAAFVLYDGIPSKKEVERIALSAPHQEACRYSEKELTLSRANKSGRLFKEVVDALSNGRQPDAQMIGQIGYLMRTTAVYGNGKFGISDRDRFADRQNMTKPFQAEMLTVWLVRAFTHDLVEHIAAARSTHAVKLDRHLKRYLGIGNATGLGMAPFLVSHPQLLNAWATAREHALVRVLNSTRDIGQALEEKASQVQKHLNAWNVDDHRQMERIEKLREEFSMLDLNVQTWASLWHQTEDLSFECQELVQAILIDLNPELVDDLAEELGSNLPLAWHPEETVNKLLSDIENKYSWALGYDFSSRKETALFWYTSEEKLEPRLGRRFEEPGAEKERPLDIARQVQSLYSMLQTADPDQKLAFFFVENPSHRAIAARIQTCRDLPFAEIQDNLIAETTLPIDMLRFKLAMFGANKFDPKSDLWTRITLFQGAPLIDDDDLGADWSFAVL